MNRSTSFAIHLFFLIIVTAYSHITNEHTCIHDYINFEPLVPPAPEGEGVERFLSQAYQNIRIFLDLSTLIGVPDEFKSYLTNDVLPPAINYFQGALKVKPMAGKLTAHGQATLCDDAIKINSTYSTENGVYADLVIFVTQTNEPSSSFSAYAGACMLDSVTKRPIFGRLNLNMAKIFAAADDTRIEFDIGVIMHEMTHILAFSSSLYQYYINPDANLPLKDHILKRTANTNLITILNIEPLTTRLRNHFGCPTLEGAYIENQEDSGKAGSHFDKSIIYNDHMTANVVKDLRITQFSLSLLEGSGWYQVDYSLAEPANYGLNKGCSFLDNAEGSFLEFDDFSFKKTFSNTKIEREEFCKRGCSRRGICENKVCKCLDGWSLNDCSKKIYVDNCARCANNEDPRKTSCYGDSCECNPSDVVCMCQLGLFTGTECTLSASSMTKRNLQSNISPTAAFSVTSANNLFVSFNGGISSDIDGNIATYAWNFGDPASGSSNTAGGTTANHQFTTAGNYVVTLTVTDNQGATATISQTFTVGTASQTPTAAFTVSKNNLQVSFNGATSSSPNGNIVSFSWNFGESSSGSNTASGTTANHQYAAAGSYTVTLTVTDNQGATATTSQTVIVGTVNQNPTAAFTVTKNNLQVSFNGGTSSDPDGNIVSYAWNFGESSSGSNTASGSTANHQYTAAGSYTVALTVTDNQGATATTSQTITVSAANQSPTAAFSVTKNNLQVSFNGGTSSDPDGNIVSYAWNFGEPSSGSSNSASGSTSIHTYGAAGSYSVTLTVTDNQGATGTSTQTIAVTAPNVSPIASFATTRNFLQINFNAAASQDTDGSIVSYSWNFGETSSGSSNTATGITTTHTYASAGQFTVTLIVTDNQGATGTSSQTLTVSPTNISPSASFTVSKNNLQASLNGSGSTDPDGNIVSYAWSFGEPTSGTSNAATGITSSHTYLSAGSYTVTLTVTDNLGATGTYSQDISVTLSSDTDGGSTDPSKSSDGTSARGPANIGMLIGITAGIVLVIICSISLCIKYAASLRSKNRKDPRRVTGNIVRVVPVNARNGPKPRPDFGDASEFSIQRSNAEFNFNMSLNTQSNLTERALTEERYVPYNTQTL